jgi:hypothetical protein
VNTGNICFANAVLQLLVNFPSFWNLFGELGDLKAQRGAGLPETGGGGATPLLDATVRFFNESSVGEGLPLTQQWLQPATGGTSRADEEKKGNVVDLFEPTYMYDAMKDYFALQLSKTFHPDVNKEPQASEKFLAFSEVYAVLGDDDRQWCVRPLFSEQEKTHT